MRKATGNPIDALADCIKCGGRPEAKLTLHGLFNMGCWFECKCGHRHKKESGPAAAFTNWQKVNNAKPV